VTTEKIEEMVRTALRAAVKEARRDPQFLQRIARAVCEELGADPLIGQYLASRIVQERRQ
jgi:hypothetical protein